MKMEMKNEKIKMENENANGHLKYEKMKFEK